jgi:energy-converting hydrogenase Eha subunit E
MPERVYPPEIIRQVKEGIEHWQKSAKESDTTRLEFHHKLAVLSAGSIAVIASGVGAVIGFAKSNPQIVIPAFSASVIIATSSLWFALLLSVLHNYFETIVLERTSIENRNLVIEQMGDWLTGRTAELRPIPDDPHVQRTLKMQKMQLWISGTAVLCFVIGYFALAYLICLEATSLVPLVSVM